MTNPTDRSELYAARRQGLWLVWSVGVFSVFVNLLMLTGPLFMLQVYDRVLGSRSEETLVALFMLVAALFGLMAMLDYARGRVLARYGARFQSALDARVFDVVLRRALNAKDRASPATGLRDLEAMQTLLTSPGVLALFDAPWTPVFLAAIFVFHPMLGWLALAGAAVLVVVTVSNNLLTKHRTLSAQNASAKAQGFAEEARKAAEVVRAQGMTGAITKRWLGLRVESIGQGLGASDWTGLFTAFTKSFRLFLQSTMLAVGAWLVLQGELTGGAMIAGSILMGRALAPVEQLLGQWPQFQRAHAGWRSLGALLASTPVEQPAVALPRPAARLAINNVSLYAAEKPDPILRNITLSVAPGEVLGVIGKSGTGKSTLARMIVGLVDPTAGELRLDGATLDQYGFDQLGGYIGYLPQEVTLFSGSVLENIARMSTDPDEAAVIAAAKAANAHEMILKLPNGYQTVLNGNDSQLSGGQRQRVALARALYQDPVLLVLDEPNSALDTDGTDALNRAVRAFKASDRAAIIMTHRPAAIAECDQLAVIEEGRLTANGPRDEVLGAMVKNASAVKQSLGKGAS